MSTTSGSLPWTSAMVTGASSGIGEAVAEVLARRGVPRLVLVARRRARLDGIAERLHRRCGTIVEVLPADLTEPAGLAAVVGRLRAGPPVDLLVNNAGVGTPGVVVEADPDALVAQVALNVTAPMVLARAVAPGMVERGAGAICNVASIAAYQPTPGSAVYAAGKSFVASFGEALHEELRGTGVTVTTVCPGFTRTEFQVRMGDSGYDSAPGFAWMSAEAVAAAAVDAAAAGKPLCVPGLGYKAAVAAVSPLPRTTRRWAMGRLWGLAGRWGAGRRRPRPGRRRPGVAGCRGGVTGTARPGRGANHGDGPT